MVCPDLWHSSLGTETGPGPFGRPKLHPGFNFSWTKSSLGPAHKPPTRHPTVRSRVRRRQIRVSTFGCCKNLLCPGVLDLFFLRSMYIEGRVWLPNGIPRQVPASTHPSVFSSSVHPSTNYPYIHPSSYSRTHPSVTSIHLPTYP